MQQGVVDKAKGLLQKGRTFNFDNFAIFNSRNFPMSFTSDYAAWKVKTETFLNSTFGRSSPLFENFKEADKIHVLGNYEDKFNQQIASFLGILEAAIDTLEFEPQKMTENTTTPTNNKVFIVHGHDERMKEQLEIFLREVGLESVVLHRQADEGQTVIEKFERHSDVGYAFILLTPDDIGYPVAEEAKSDEQRAKEKRARQNVIFEFGYFVAKLSRRRVCCLYKRGVALPTDISGIIYKEVTSTVESIGISILKDLRAVGYQVNL